MNYFSDEYVFDNVKEGIDLVRNGRTVVFMGEESLNQYLKESPMPDHVRILWLPVYYGNMIFHHNSPLRPGTYVSHSQGSAKEWSLGCVNSRPEGVRRRDSRNLGLGTTLPIPLVQLMS